MTANYSKTLFVNIRIRTIINSSICCLRDLRVKRCASWSTLFGQIAFAFQATAKVKQGKCRRRKRRVVVNIERKTHREELEGRIRVHIPGALLEGAGTLTVSTPGTVIVKVPDSEHLRLKPVHAALRLDTSLSSAACGSEKSPRFVGHHEIHLGKSITLEAETQDTITNHRKTLLTSLWTNYFSVVLDLP